MNNDLAPTYQRLYGEYWVLWYATSNSYSVIEKSFKTILDCYFQSSSIDDFDVKLKSSHKDYNYKVLALEVSNYLKSCNVYNTQDPNTTTKIDTSFRKVIKQYTLKGKNIRIHYSSELVSKIIHPALAHLETQVSINKATTIFDIYLKDDNLHLYKNKKPIVSVSKKDYHIIQGKFIMQLLCTIHDKKESDWMATFHGSTVTDGKSSILFIGASGKGKSTLCSLLVSNGFDLIADDVTPMLAEDSHIYQNPSAISIKEGSFNVLQKSISNFKNLPVVELNKTKGPLRYFPCPSPNKNAFPCKAIVLVNYQINHKTEFNNVSIKTILETLIPESWLSPSPLHAKKHLDWLETVQFYKLTYSDTKEVIKTISKAFKNLNVN